MMSEMGGTAAARGSGRGDGPGLSAVPEASVGRPAALPGLLATAGRNRLPKFVKPSRALMFSVRDAFLRAGYAGLTMVGLAQACGVSRRTLYNHFPSKDDALREWVRFNNGEEVRLGLEAGEARRRAGADAVEIMTAIMDARYGETRRNVTASPHNVELNAVVFMLCRDIMIEAATAFQRQLAGLISSLERDGLLRLRGGTDPETVAQILANGARGVNQGLPPPPSGELTSRYRDMCRAVLFGCADPPASER